KLSMRDSRVFAPMQDLVVRDVVGDHCSLGEPVRTDLADVDVVLLRQDPPFDMAYVTSTHLLERVHPQTLVVNDPAHVRNAPEKIMVTLFPDLMPPTLITRDREAIEEFRDEHGEIVMKPLYGNGGAAVFKTGAKDPNFGSLFDLFSTMFREPWVVQRFLPAVVKGDKRIILVDGEPLGGVNRVPAENDMKERGLLFVGIDVIDGHLTEINVTSPTGLRAIKRLGGPDLSKAIWDRIEAKRG
ncbi:MAG: glutathione synthase, partial [Rhizobiales bacterium]|nr:glutathione synthase [Hyphomicrobiales bacterium]